MHEGMQHDPIQGQGQGDEPFKVGNPAIFKSYLHLSILVQYRLMTNKRMDRRTDTAHTTLS